jgi:DNA-binding transcriptional ArsR family regulator
VPATLELDQVFQALSDPTRRQVVERLVAGSASTSELAAPFAMSLPSFTQHLGVLEKAGVVTSSKTGRVRTYQLSPVALRAADGWLAEQRRLWEQRLDQLDRFLVTVKERSEPAEPRLARAGEEPARTRKPGPAPRPPSARRSKENE